MGHKSKRIAILAANGYEDLELHYPRLRLIEAGHHVSVIGLDSKPVTGKHGYPQEPDLAIENADHRQFDGIIVPGGTLSPDYIRRVPEANQLVATLFRDGKLVAAICHGGWVLISAGILRGKKATSFFAIKDDMVNAGVEFIDEEVVVDGNLVTSRQPSDLPAFMTAILAFLEGT